MSLINQITKARKINSTICLINGCAHKHVTACRSVSQLELNYQQVIQATSSEMVGGHKVTVYNITCQQIQATGLVNCKGNSHCYTLCQHSIAGLWATIKALGKRISLCPTFASAKRLLNLYKRAGGKLVKLMGKTGFCYAIIH